MATNFPPAPNTRERQPNRGWFVTPTVLGPYEGFAVGISGRARRDSAS
ncbi:hypothetical protein [Micromonospora sp. NPDC004704]